MTKRAALILAGGKARRFQSKDQKWEDKALAKLSGKPLLIRAIECVQDIVDEIWISVNDKERKKKYAEVLKNHDHSDTQIVVDQIIDHISGPNVAIMSGLVDVRADYCLILPTDMPFLKPNVAQYLFDESLGFDITIPMWPNGRLETLLAVIQRQNGLQITETLCQLQRPRSDDIPRGSSKVLLVSPLSHIKTIDPELQSFININFKENLIRPQNRRVHGPITENIKLNLGTIPSPTLLNLKEAAKMLQEGAWSQAQSSFASCANSFETMRIFFWAGLSAENQGQALLKLSGLQTESKGATELDFAGKEAYMRAANYYRVEAETHEENRCRLLAERALADKAWSESWAMGKDSHVHRYPSKVG